MKKILEMGKCYYDAVLGEKLYRAKRCYDYR